MILPKAKAQMSLTGQLRARTEFRDGLGNPQIKDGNPAFFTSQRTRLNFGYKWDKLTFQTVIQDVRVWGQDASTISNADGNKLMLHEAWGEVLLATTADTNSKLKIDNLSIKVGRQELVYDDHRLLGNLDWLQQGRRHDAALLKLLHHGYQADLGFAFNQNTDRFGYNGTAYTPGNTNPYFNSSKGIPTALPADFVPTAGKGGAPQFVNPPNTNAGNQMYKMMQFIYLSKKFGQTKISTLFFKDDFAKYRLDSIGSSASPNGVVYGRRFDTQLNDLNSRITTGAFLSTQIGNASSAGKIALNGGGYYQGGKDRDGNKLRAWHAFGYAMYQKGIFGVGPGFDILSGNNTTNPADKVNRRFDPLYGTPHKFWGFMDYYYVGTGSPAAGLQNYYLKFRVAPKDLIISLDVHKFATQNKLIGPGTVGEMKKNLGYEFDLIVNYNINKFTNIEAGYCVYLANNSTEAAKLNSINKTEKFNQWAYLMLNIRPDFLFTKPVAIKN
jgi:hypothetical protein